MSSRDGRGNAELRTEDDAGYEPIERDTLPASGARGPKLARGDLITPNAATSVFVL